jgi:hypothetical protein
MEKLDHIEKLILDKIQKMESDKKFATLKASHSFNLVEEHQEEVR